MTFRRSGQVPYCQAEYLTHFVVSGVLLEEEKIVRGAVFSCGADYPMHGQGTGMKEAANSVSCCHICPETASGEGGLRRFPGAIRSDVVRSMRDVVETANQLEDLRARNLHNQAAQLSTATGVNAQSPFLPLGYFNIVQNMPHEPTHVLPIGTIGGVCTLTLDVMTYHHFKGYKKLDFTAQQKKQIDSAMHIVESFFPPGLKKLNKFKTEFWSGNQSL